MLSKLWYLLNLPAGENNSLIEWNCRIYSKKSNNWKFSMKTQVYKCSSRCCSEVFVILNTNKNGESIIKALHGMSVRKAHCSLGHIQHSSRPFWPSNAKPDRKVAANSEFCVPNSSRCSEARSRLQCCLAAAADHTDLPGCSVYFCGGIHHPWCDEHRPHTTNEYTTID